MQQQIKNPRFHSLSPPLRFKIVIPYMGKIGNGELNPLVGNTLAVTALWCTSRWFPRILINNEFGTHFHSDDEVDLDRELLQIGPLSLKEEY
jgi:hypothetical protein